MERRIGVSAWINLVQAIFVSASTSRCGHSGGTCLTPLRPHADTPTQRFIWLRISASSQSNASPPRVPLREAQIPDNHL
jgi:hypothetical protein